VLELPPSLVSFGLASTAAQKVHEESGGKRDGEATNQPFSPHLMRQIRIMRDDIELNLGGSWIIRYLDDLFKGPVPRAQHMAQLRTNLSSFPITKHDLRGWWALGE
jgi:hypothetical protein